LQPEHLKRRAISGAANFASGEFGPNTDRLPQAPHSTQSAFELTAPFTGSADDAESANQLACRGKFSNAQ
jgi:hypothetical protein